MGKSVFRDRESDRQSRELIHSLDPPKIDIVTGAPLIALCNTRCTLAPVPRCNLDFKSSICPRRAAIASPGPKTGQKSKGAGSVLDALM